MKKKDDEAVIDLSAPQFHVPVGHANQTVIRVWLCHLCQAKTAVPLVLDGKDVCMDCAAKHGKKKE